MSHSWLEAVKCKFPSMSSRNHADLSDFDAQNKFTNPLNCLALFDFFLLAGCLANNYLNKAWQAQV